MAKELIDRVGVNAQLFRDPDTGIAWVEDGTTGTSHSVHPNISDTGSVKGMITKGLWPADARTVRSHGWIFNIDKLVVTSDFDTIVRRYCQCGGTH